MNAEQLFLEHITKIKKRALWRTMQRGLLVAFVLFLLATAFATGLEKTGVLRIRETPVFYGVILGIALIIAFMYTLMTKQRFQDLLIDIDRRLHLQDRLSTAYEYYTQGKASDFAHLLFEDAGRTLNRLSMKDLFPPRFTNISLLLLLLVLINLGLFSFDYLASRSSQRELDQETKEKIEKLMKDYSAQKAENLRQPQEKQKQLYQRMDELAKQLQEQALNRQELSNAANQMLKEVQSEQSRLAEDLESQLNEQQIEDFQELTVQNTPSFQQLSPEDLQKLEQLLKQMFNNQVPEMLGQTLSDLSDFQNLENLLSQMLDELGEEIPDSSEEADTKAEPEDSAQQDQSDTAGSGETEQGMGQNQAGADAQKPGQDATQPGEGQGQQDGRGERSDEERNMSDDGEQGSSITAGRGKADGSQYAPYPMQDSSGPTLEDHTVPGKKSEYNIHIRSVTSIGNATIPEEEITRTYQREVESILQKEEIPVNYREYIKNYFISIGLTQSQ